MNHNQTLPLAWMVHEKKFFEGISILALVAPYEAGLVHFNKFDSGQSKDPLPMDGSSLYIVCSILGSSPIFHCSVLSFMVPYQVYYCSLIFPEVYLY